MVLSFMWWGDKDALSPVFVSHRCPTTNRKRPKWLTVCGNIAEEGTLGDIRPTPGEDVTRIAYKKCLLQQCSHTPLNI